MKDEFYKAILDESPTGYSYQKIILNDEGIPCDFEFLEVNPAFENYWGIQADDVIGKKGSEFFFGIEDESVNWLQLFADVALNQNTKILKQYSHFSNTWFSMKIYSPEKFYFIVRYQDITKEISHAIEIEEFFKINLDMLSITKTDGTFIRVNQAWEKVLGYTVEELKGINVLTLVHPDDLKETMKITGQPQPIFGFINRYRCKDGTYRYLEWHGQPRGELIFASARDITTMMEEKKYLEQIAYASEILLQMSHEDVDYQAIADTVHSLSKAEFVFFNLYDPKGIQLTTVSISGLEEHIRIAENILGYSLTEKKWILNTTRKINMNDNTTFVYDDLFQLTNAIIPAIPKSTIHNLYSYFAIGQVAVLKILKDNQILGDFTMIMAKDKEFDHNDFVSIYSRQVGLLLERINSDKKVLELLAENEIIFNETSTALFLVGIEEGASFKYIKQNRSHEKLTGFSHKSFCNKSPQELLGKELGLQIEGNYMRCIQEGISISYEETLPLPSGLRTWKTTLTPIFEDNKPIFIVGSSQDVTVLNQRIEEIRYLSFHDPLTGIYNRAFFEEELLRLDTERNLPLTIVMADANDLKLTNDAFGHMMGDELLIKAAEVIKTCCRDDDIIARLGGDEFIILLPNVNEEDAKKIVSRIRMICSSTYVTSIPLSISFGWETKNHIDEDISEIQKRAEDKMYSRKLFESSNRREKPITSILKTLYEKYDHEEKHSITVSKLSEAIGKELHFTEEELNELSQAALLHDIGKIGIKQNILNKPQPLTPEEWRIIKRHPEIGYRILNSIHGLSNISDYILSHHEHFDGTGYPKGLKGNEIPIQGRIISLANAYDAMLNDRPYHKSLSLEETINEIKESSGTQFDPMLVEVFLRMLKNKNSIL